jgi:O-antigen/teichoic acid export membrane protein
VARKIAVPAINLLRYSLALIGPIGSAGAQFLLSLVLLKTVDQTIFGRFSFLLIASQLSLGIWSALLCAPLPILQSSKDLVARDQYRATLIAVNLFGSCAALAVFTVIGMLLGERTGVALLFAIYAATSLLRWFARAHAYAMGEQLRTTASDITYCAVLIAGCVFLWFEPTRSLGPACFVLLVATVVGLAPFGKAYLKEQFITVSPRSIGSYGSIWRRLSSWSLFGVMTTEATANSHAYLVTLILGPTAFAPIAASALMIRPINVAMNALTEFERAQMARQIGDDRIDLATKAVRFFRGVLILLWVAVAIGIVVLLEYAPRLIFPSKYDLNFLTTSAVLWMLVSAVRLLRTPDSALLQAAGAFRELAFASVWSSIISVGAVLGLLLAFGPIWSIAGILIGEGIFAGFIWQQSRRWLKTADEGKTNGATTDVGALTYR